MKKISILLTVMLLSGCAVQPTANVNPLTDFSATAPQVPAELPTEPYTLTNKDWYFLSAEEAENLTDEDVNNWYQDFMKWSYDEVRQDNSTPPLYIEVLIPPIKHQNDVSAYAAADIATLTDADTVNEGQDLAIGGMIRSFKNIKSRIFDENPEYIQASVSYKETRKQNQGNNLTADHYYMNETRFYPKHIFMDNYQYFYTGEMTKESILSAFNLINYNNKFILYCDITEEGNSFELTYYTAKIVYVDFGMIDRVEIYKTTVTVDKSTGLIQPYHWADDDDLYSTLMKSCKIYGAVKNN